MSAPTDSTEPIPPNLSGVDLAAVPAEDRHSDVVSKQAQVMDLLGNAGCEALVVLEPENFAWLTGGAVAHGILDPADGPGLYCTPEQRWLLARNVDVQRLFDEELDGLGFQVKEWPWFGGRPQLLDYLGRNRRLACDRPLGEAPVVADQLQQRRLVLTPYEIARMRELGEIVSHALEATGRSMTLGQTEQEIAGHLAHRLTHRGVEPIAVEVAVDGRSRRCRQSGFTAAPLRQYCVLSATGRRFGLYATASRTVVFGTPDEALQKEHDAACKIVVTYLNGTVADANVQELLLAGRRVYRVAGFEHEWRLCPPGHVTGRAAVERAWLAKTTDVLRPGWAVTWRASVGAACCCDTFLITAEGPRNVTKQSVQWPHKRIKIGGGSLSRPDLLVR